MSFASLDYCKSCIVFFNSLDGNGFLIDLKLSTIGDSDVSDTAWVLFRFIEEFSSENN
jgi:hypothetical protein